MSEVDKFERVRAAVEAVGREVEALKLPIEEEDLPEDVRYELHRLACSFDDYTFWVRRRAQNDDLGTEPSDQMYYALEVETGIGAWGVTAREALDRYWHRDVLDLPRVGADE